MAMVLRSGPNLEPVTIEEVKAHLRVDASDEDALLASLVLTSRLHIEAALGIALVNQSWRMVLDVWPKSGIVAMPIGPVMSIEEVRVLGAHGDVSTVASETYHLDVAGRPQRLVPHAGTWPDPGRRTAGIEIDLVAGYGAAAQDVPAPIRQALLLLIAHWYEHRDPFEIGAPQTNVPNAVSRLLGPYRAVRL
ncbi:MAG: head-tail connector protein [Hyphomicrobiaceae bacterium]